MVKKVVCKEAFFGAGCFWHVELSFSKIPGVVETEVGFMGGDESYEKLSYKEVCSGITDHAEVARIIYDPKKITYKKLLQNFWKEHDPTQVNRQGPDIGSQYRSAIFYTDEEQKKEATKSKAELQKKLGKQKIATEILKAGKFYKAENYHQKYLEKRGLNACPF